MLVVVEEHTKLLPQHKVLVVLVVVVLELERVMVLQDWLILEVVEVAMNECGRLGCSSLRCVRPGGR